MDTIDYIKKAFELKNQKYYKPAIEMLYKALEVENDNEEILYQISELYFLINNYSRALQYLEKILSKNEVHLPSLELVYLIKTRLGDFTSSCETAKKLFKQNPSSNNLKKIIDSLANQKQFDEIEKYFDSEFFDFENRIYCADLLYCNNQKDLASKLIQNFSNQDNESLQLLRCKIAFDKGNLQEAKDIISETSQSSQNPEILNFKGLFALEEMNFIEAIKNFSKAANLDKENSKYYYNLGNAYFYNGWFDEAQNAYSKAIYLSPENLDYRYSLAYFYYEKKEFDKAKKENDAILNLNPNHPQAKVLEALLFVEKKDYLTAQNILENLINSGYDNIFAKISLCKIYQELEIFDKALEIINKIVEQNPKNEDYLIILQDLYIRQNQYDKAIETGKNILKFNENYIEAYILCAKASYLNKDYENSKYYAQEAISLDMNYSKGYYYLALTRFETNEFEEAVECMKRAIIHDLTNPLYYAKMGEFYKNAKDYKTALGYFSEATNLSDSNEYKFLYSETLKLLRNNKILQN